MIIPSFIKNNRALLSFMTVLLIFLSIANIVTLSHQRKQILNEAHRHAKAELDLIGTLVREALIKHDYATVEESLIQWATEHGNVMELNAITPNNFMLAKYKSKDSTDHPFRIEQSVRYEGRELVTLAMVKDFTSIDNSLNKLHLKLIAGSVFLMTVLGIALWYTLRRMAFMPMEKEIAGRKQAEDALQEANDDLEIKVDKRTEELISTVEQLHSEIIERKHIENKIEHDYHIQSVISAVLQISMEPISFEKQLVHILDHILSVPWLELKSKGCIFLKEDADVLVLKAQKGMSESLQNTCAKIPFGKCLCGRAASTREIVFTDRVNDHHDIHYQGMLPHGHYNVPILSGSKVLGVICLYLDEGHQRKEDDDEFLTAIANALAGVIERKKAEEHVIEESEISSSLLQIFETLNVSLDRRQLIRSVMEIIPKYLKFDKVSILLYEKELGGFVIAGSYGLSPVEERILLTKTFKKEDLQSINNVIKGETVIINDARNHNLLSEDIVSTYNIAGAVLLPIYIGRKVRGILIGGYEHVRTVQFRDEALLKGLADGFGIALHNSRLYKESNERFIELANKIETIKVMNQIDREILTATDKDTVLNTATAMISRIIPCDRAAILLGEKGIYKAITEWGRDELPAVVL